MILTHGDQDHIGGLQAVLEQFPVAALVINGSLAESATMKKLMETALDRNIPVYSAARGMTLKPDAETKLDVLYPKRQPPVLKRKRFRSKRSKITARSCSCSK
ncbi:hypothetical protein HMSSN036_68130 [Paenibacillus macerans]|nr:hypothetical protein HMSSN036_68130 [Paenibacillus macerans]